MRLTCPNCGAQYEVPDQVIPDEGRDVQCSNCGDTWYQTHPDHPDHAPVSDETGLDETQKPETPHTPDPAVEPPTAEPDTPARRRIDPEIAGILREEAEHEARLRSSEARAGLESQPDLGLDNAPDPAREQRSREARDRMARMRGRDPAAPPQPDPDPDARRNILPDIEEINSTLRVSGNGGAPHGDPETPLQPKRRSGFARGFGLVMLVAVILLLIYANSGQIAQAMPQAAPALSAYVDLVNSGRIWLDSVIAGVTPQ